MKHIMITGCCQRCKTGRARQRYSELTARGLHVLMHDPAHPWENSHPTRRMSKADVLITVHEAEGDLKEITNGPL